MCRRELWKAFGAKREKVRHILCAPFSKEDLSKAKGWLKEAEHSYTLAMIAENMSEVRFQAGGVIYYVENAIAMLNKRYFRLGVKQAYEELEAMELKPEMFCELIEAVLLSDSAEAVKQHLTILVKETIGTFRKAEESISDKKAAVTKASLAGTYEEMYSNWRNKMYVAEMQNNKHLAFMSLVSLQAMFLFSMKNDGSCGAKRT